MYAIYGLKRGYSSGCVEGDIVSILRPVKPFIPVLFLLIAETSKISL